MDKVDEFKLFLESVRDLNPSLVSAIDEGTDTIFEAAKKRKKRKMNNPFGKVYNHPYKWGGWFTGNYSGGVSGVSDVADIGMGGAMASIAGGDGGGGE